MAAPFAAHSVYKKGIKKWAKIASTNSLFFQSTAASKMLSSPPPWPSPPPSPPPPPSPLRVQQSTLLNVDLRRSKKPRRTSVTRHQSVHLCSAWRERERDGEE
ncbi:Uncharacterized protein Adt_13458 [Abeliophyllum distichum]|uniref:Uncharacterized protein n=1 Tax=Abeliophyllum distichum TaxID=126358 RepID=A0ABD1TWV4_9LAMI